VFALAEKYEMFLLSDSSPILHCTPKTGLFGPDDDKVELAAVGIATTSNLHCISRRLLVGMTILQEV
jgi:hypothetical protein